MFQTPALAFGAFLDWAATAGSSFLEGDSDGAGMVRRPVVRTTTRPVPLPATRPTTAACGEAPRRRRATSVSASLPATASSRPPLVCGSKMTSSIASVTPSAGWTASREDSRFRSMPPGTTPSARHASSPSKTGRSSQTTSTSTPEERAISARWPARPKPVTSVQAWAPTSRASSDASRLSALIEAAIVSAAPAGARPICSANASTPVPSGLVSTSRSPGRAPALVRI